jgi:predicted MFS family arabinose efflux permease
MLATLIDWLGFIKNCLLCKGKLMNVLGRKRALIFVTLISLGGWILLVTANHIITICIARFICGWVAACHGLIGEKVYICGSLTYLI